MDLEHPNETGSVDAVKAQQRAALPVIKRLIGKPVASALHMASKRREQRMPMVGWFDPGQLLRTGVKTLFSLIVGERSDRRLMLALASTSTEPFVHTHYFKDGEDGPEPDIARERDELWIDFICDTGDGWNPTYAIAYAAAQDQLKVADGKGGTIDLPRGDVLLFGGDEVYPTPSREEYQRRLVMPFTKAFGDAKPLEQPVAYAIPGNHDWYDGLNAFSRLFCSDVGGRAFAGWRTQQQRSYFALKLPGNWWLLGSDGQLQSDLDTGQIEYFRSVAVGMSAGDKVVLCLSLPVWTYAHKYRTMGRVFDETDLMYLRDQVFTPCNVEVKLYLTGDLHHYRRHEEVGRHAAAGSPVQKITAGGGGAFLHPTHEEDLSVITESAEDGQGAARTFAEKKCYPDPAVSSRLAWGNLLFLFKNPKAGILPAILYLMTAWLVGASYNGKVVSDPWRAFEVTLQQFEAQPGIALWMLGLWAVFIAFTDTHSTLYRIVAGTLHWAVHWVAIFYIGWGSFNLSTLLLGDTFGGAVLTAAMIFGGGWMAGCVILGLYLLISINVFGRHSEEAFSALRIEDFKHFLRMRVAADGSLTIYPIKVEKVPRQWRFWRNGDTSRSVVQPVPPITPELIEDPIVLR